MSRPVALPEPPAAAVRPTHMRFVTLALLVVLVAACGSRTGDVADDPAGGGSESPPPGMPAEPGLVGSRGVVTVLDDGDGPEACLGPVAESYPPQCGGPPIKGWDWKDQLPDTYQQASGVTWGQYGVTGRWDGARAGGPGRPGHAGADRPRARS